ncbi:hypothetical protein [Sphingobacterium sp. NPDC055346]|nr:hypothetical protein [Sphingobacterium mizutaii]
MKKYFYILSVLFLIIMLGACSKDKENCNPDDEESPCYAGVGKSNAECWYSVTINGKTTLPNAFGQDKIVLTSGENEELPDGNGFSFMIRQAKANSSDPAILSMAGNALLNHKLPKGTYPGIAFATMPFSVPEFTAWPYYLNEEDSDLPRFKVTIMENSDKRMWAKMSIMTEEIMPESTDEPRVTPIEVEVKIGRKYFAEMPLNGKLYGGAVCNCQK